MIEITFDFNDKKYQIVMSEKETRKGSTLFYELDLTSLDTVSRQVYATLENEFYSNGS